MQQLLQHLFRKNTLQEITVESLRQFTRQYPSFAAGHFFLAKKLHDVHDVAFAEQFQKTLVYFHNPLWLQHQLHETGTDHATEAADRNGTAIPDKHALPAAEPEAGREPFHDAPAETPLKKGQALEKFYSLPLKTGLPEEALRTAPERQADEMQQTGENKGTGVAQGAMPAPAGDHGQTVQQDEPFAFQSYHTIDYFASQGIKLSLEAQPDDKLGRQLKSFTEWLKTMRRLPQPAEEEVIEKHEDETIEQFAAHSLEEKEVITEAMAEVLMKQGKLDKARAMYHKLSLLNPQKSAYFAAKSKF